MQLILPYVFRCDCPDCNEWLDRHHLTMYWYEEAKYYSHIRCKLAHRRILIGNLNIGGNT